jgi:hypothetical protein
MAEDNLIIRSPFALTEVLKTTNSDGVEVLHVNLDGATPETAQFTGRKGIPVLIGPTDPVSDIPVFIDFAHHQNHEGESYQYQYYNAELNGTANFRLTVPAYATAIRCPHLSFDLICDRTSSLFLFEAPTISAGTAVTTIRNRNRIGTPNVPGMTIKTAPTVGANGTQIAQYITIVSSRSSINMDASKAEWILKPSTEYLVSITTGASSIVMLRMNWYEDLGA